MAYQEELKQQIEQRDYSDLIGKEVWCYQRPQEVWKSNKKWKAKGFVAAIDPTKGITIKHKETQTDLICVKRGANYTCSYQKIFNYFISEIERGHIRLVGSPNKPSRTYGSFNGCAFD